MAAVFVVIVIQAATSIPMDNAQADAMSMSFASTAKRSLNKDGTGGRGVKVGGKFNLNSTTVNGQEFIRGVQNTRVGAVINSRVNIQNATCKNNRHACKIVQKVRRD
jgi:hypothetical protein